MAGPKKPPSALSLEDHDDSSRPTALDLRPLAAPAQPKEAPGDETLRVTGGTGYRVAPMVNRFRLVGAKSFECKSGVCQVGTHESNDLVLVDPTVSRFHCEVRIEDRRPVVRDLGSTNGTFVDGVRVREAYLKHGNTLTLGEKATLRFELDEKVSAVPVSEQARFGSLIGISAAMRAIFSVLEKAARTDATVIIEGETGTGKSRAAQAIHQAGARANQPFLVLDCSALPPTLLEGELFGHEKGAFTGATAKRMGVFEEAHGGTVLLDEIGDMPTELQPKLLRVLEDKQIRRLGQNQWTPVDVRIITATHKDLREEVNAGRFRSDLYFRLAVVRVTMPSLRSRPEDLPAIAQALLESLGATAKTHPALFAPAFLSGLTRVGWPGNVRELRNYLERCLVFQEPAPMADGPLAASAAPGASLAGVPLSVARRHAVDAFERTYVDQLLSRHGGKVSQAALEAEVDRVYLHRLMRKHGITSKK